MPRERLFLIDGFAHAYRSYYALIRNPLTTSRGLNVSAVYGFATLLLDLLENEQPKYLAVVLDTLKPTFRNELYGEYKANRRAMPDPLREQLPYIERLVEAMDLPFFREQGYEADDVIGSLARQATEAGLDCYIVSSDKDLAQLVDDHVWIYERKGSTTKVIGPPEVRARFGVEPERMVDLLALMGDSSDNVPGIPGVGVKTAQKLLEQFGTFELVLEGADQIAAKGVRKKVHAGIASAKLSRQLVEIDRHVDVPLDLERMRIGRPRREDMVELLGELEFNHLLRKFTPGADLTSLDYTRLVDEEALAAWLPRLSAGAPLAFSLIAEDGALVGAAFAVEPGTACFVPLRRSEGPAGGLFDLVDDSGWQEAALAFTKTLLEAPEARLLTHDLKRALGLCEAHGIALGAACRDSMLESYLYDPGPPSSREDSWRHGLGSCAARLLNIGKMELSALVGKGRKRVPMREASLDGLTRFGCEEADFSLRLSQFLFPQLKKLALLQLYEEIELPLARMLFRMEQAGVRLDLAMLRSFSSRLADELGSLGEEIYLLAGERFNVDSPKQLAAVLYDRLALHQQPGVGRLKRTKTGISTDQSVLEQLAEAHPLPGKILRYRALSKLKGTYTDALPALVSRRTGRVHTSFNQCATATGRLSSSDPNLQNIPIRTELGREVRRAFVPREEGWKLLSADYSQIELRILAHYSEDEDLIETFRQGADIHTATAAKVFGVPADDVTKTMRSRAKAVNFGLLYGMGPNRLARENGMELEEAKQFIEQYFASFPTIRAFIDETKREARRTCQVRTLLGRLRRLDDIRATNRMVRAQAESMAVNTPIQGTAADLIKIAMLRIEERLREEGLRATMVLQVHDELVFDVPEDELERVRTLVIESMEGALALKVPLKVDAGSGAHWLEAH